MTELNAAARARILASKAEFDNEMARAEEAELSIQQEKEAASFSAGREWAMNDATYKEMLEISRSSPIQMILDKDMRGVEMMRGHLRRQFLEGVKSVLDELKKD